MLNEFRVQTIIWDKANSKIYETIKASEGDSNGRKLRVQILDNGKAINLSGSSLSLAWKSTTNKGLDKFDLVDANKGIFEIFYTTEMLSTSGKVTASLVLIDSVGRLESDPFSISISRSIVDDDSVQSENSFTTLTEILVRVTDLEENYTPRLNEVTTQLAQNADRMNGIAINAMYPPVPFSAVVPDANYYDEENFKYYKDEEMTIPATDNQPILQGLVNYLSDMGGGTIEVPNGKYVFRRTINWKTKVSLRGAGKLSTSFFTEGVTHSFITGIEGAGDGSDADKPEVWFEDCSFTDFLVDNKGLSLTEPTVGGKALFIIYMKRALFRDLILLNTLGTALGCDHLVDTVIENVFTDRAGRSSYPVGFGGNSGIGVGTSALSEEPIVITNCFTYNSGNYGIFVETQNNPSGVKAKYAKIVNCHAMGNRLGFGNKGSGGAHWINCSAFNNRSHGFHLTQDTSGDSLIACISEFNGGDGVSIESTYLGDLEISNLKSNHNGGNGIRALKNIRDGLKNVRLSDIQASYNSGSGIWFLGETKNISLYNIDAINNGQDTSVSPTYRRGIRIDGVNDILNIVNATVFDDQETRTQVVGIDISATTTNYLIDDINLSGYGQNEGLALKSSLDNGKLGLINGYLTEVSGTATIADGLDSVDVVHNIGHVPTKIMLTPKASGQLFTSIVDNGRVRVRRNGTEGVLNFNYYIGI